MIGCFNRLIKSVRLYPTVRLNCPITTLQNKAANAQNTFEEVIMVMIEGIIYQGFSARLSDALLVADQ